MVKRAGGVFIEGLEEKRVIIAIGFDAAIRKPVNIRNRSALALKIDVGQAVDETLFPQELERPPRRAQIILIRLMVT